jgi:hypothetical protein
MSKGPEAPLMKAYPRLVVYREPVGIEELPFAASDGAMKIVESAFASPASSMGRASRAMDLRADYEVTFIGQQNLRSFYTRRARSR